ncbi:hypothetical protein V6N13_061150 [Hibiscus sabdariffa]
MATNSSSSADGLPSRFNFAAAKERYHKIVVAKSRWEEQGFFFNDGLENYGLEPIIYKRLYDLSWLRFGRQPARANLSWVREFYAHNAEGEDTVNNIRDRRVPANSATINRILDLPENLANIYKLMGTLEDVDYDTIKDQLCMSGTEWNMIGKNPGTISCPHLLPEAKLWNTFMKRNLMPTSHNQTVDRTRLVLINAIISGFKFDMGKVIAKELSEACHNDKGILAFPCIISALCRRAAVPTSPKDKFTPLQTGWTLKEYMRKMDLTNFVPLQMAMPTPPASHQSPAETPAPSTAEAQNDTPVANPSPAHTPEAHASFASTPTTPPSPPVPAPTTETTPSI